MWVEKVNRAKVRKRHRAYLFYVSTLKSLFCLCSICAYRVFGTMSAVNRFYCYVELLKNREIKLSFQHKHGCLVTRSTVLFFLWCRVFGLFNVEF